MWPGKYIVSFLEKSGSLSYNDDIVTSNYNNCSDFEFLLRSVNDTTESKLVNPKPKWVSSAREKQIGGYKARDIFPLIYLVLHVSQYSTNTNI